MNRAIGIRLPKEILEKIEEMSKTEMEDRSTIIRKLVIEGYLNLIKKKSAEEYIGGRITLSQASKLAGLTLWEMEEYLLSQGFISRYSIDNLEKEMKILK
ncbi:UPF0175 family protein [Candidatus Pacearchaeota archaeon]|nr:UPF0175 family protein [Candidatus Pacearchaeota archaeon]